MNEIKRKLTTGFIILLSLVLGYFFLTENREPPAKHTERLNALKEMNGSILIDDNESLFEDELDRELDRQSDEILKVVYEVSADAEGWEYVGQEVVGFAETKNSDAPFVTTVFTFFRHPEDSDVSRGHTKTWIYVVDRGWMPVIQDAFHHEDRKEGHNRWFNKANVWDGDYEN